MGVFLPVFSSDTPADKFLLCNGRRTNDVMSSAPSAAAAPGVADVVTAGNGVDATAAAAKKSYSVRLICWPGSARISHGRRPSAHVGVSDVTTLAMYPDIGLLTGSTEFVRQRSAVAASTSNASSVRVKEMFNYLLTLGINIFVLRSYCYYTSQDINSFTKSVS